MTVGCAEYLLYGGELADFRSSSILYEIHQIYTAHTWRKYQMWICPRAVDIDLTRITNTKETWLKLMVEGSLALHSMYDPI